VYARISMPEYLGHNVVVCDEIYTTEYIDPT